MNTNNFIKRRNLTIKSLSISFLYFLKSYSSFQQPFNSTDASCHISYLLYSIYFIILAAIPIALICNTGIYIFLFLINKLHFIKSLDQAVSAYFTTFFGLLIGLTLANILTKLLPHYINFIKQNDNLYFFPFQQHYKISNFSDSDFTPHFTTALEFNTTKYNVKYNKAKSLFLFIEDTDNALIRKKLLYSKAIIPTIFIFKAIRATSYLILNF